MASDHALKNHHDHQHNQKDSQRLAEKERQGTPAKTGIHRAKVGVHHQLPEAARTERRLVTQLETMRRRVLRRAFPGVQQQPLATVCILQGQ
ncbi:hypothetical protein D3C85_1737020 [compost metagenome]